MGNLYPGHVSPQGEELSDELAQLPAAGGLLALQDLEQSLVGGAECDQAAGGWSGAALHQPSHRQPVLGDTLPGRTPFQEL